MVNFDSALPGTPVETWEADPRLHDRTPLPLDAVGELIVVAAHPDDETLGAGGLIADCARRGIPVRIVVVTDGAASDRGTPGLASLRAAELIAAIRVLAPNATIDRVGLPDGATRERRDEVRAALEPIVSGSSPQALVVAPWRGDGHRDHRVVGEVTAELAAAASRTLVEYPVWLWHWGAPDDERTPWDRFAAVPVDVTTKRAAIGQYLSQIGGASPMLRSDFLANFDRASELFITEPRPLSGVYFDRTYARHDDPWGFETRWYEARKRALTLASLPDERYATALEIGCSIGVLTDSLADRCDDLLALDVSQAAVDRARARVGDRARVERVDVLADFPPGTWDLILLSEVGYYFAGADLGRVLDAIETGLAPGGTLVACHWRHPVADYPVGGDEVHAQIRDRGIPVIARHTEEDFVLEVFSHDRRSVASRTGLL